MNTIPRQAVFVWVLAVVIGGAFAQSALAQAGAAGGGQKMEDAFKNIQSLKGQPAEMLNPTMVFFEAALGVGCPFCHDADATKRDLDTKEEKKTARNMI